MCNPYITTFPDLMKGKTILYVHGFGSAASTNTVGVLQTFLPSARVIAEDIPLDPTEAMSMLRELVERERPELIIGTSMGGMYTEMLRGYDRILVNPAFEMGNTMAEHGMMGKQTFQNPRKDGVQEFIVTKAMVKQYKEICEGNFKDITPDDAARVWALFGDEDTLVHTFPLFTAHYHQAVRFHGGHRLTEHVIHRYLVPLIRRIDDIQEKRERGVVYMGINTLKDAYGNAASSMNKTYDMLLRNYDIQIVAPAPTNHPEQIAETQQWVEKYLSAPAWNKVVFTNTPHLLLGDYLIDTVEHDGFMGTCIEFGSDTFKTWEDIMVFFERLGGQ